MVAASLGALACREAPEPGASDARATHDVAGDPASTSPAGGGPGHGVHPVAPPALEEGAQRPDLVYSVERDALRASLFGERPTCGTFVPAYVDGHLQGQRLHAGTRGSELGSLGLYDGDVWVAVNGHGLDQAGGMSPALTALASEPTMRVEVARRGQRVVLEYLLR